MILAIVPLTLATVCPLSTTALSAQASAQASAQEWRTLPLPRLSVEQPDTRLAPRLVEGSHLLFPGDRARERAAPRTTQRPQIPLATLRRVLEDEARREDLGFELHPFAGVFAARGGPEAMQALDLRLADLEAAATALEISVGWAHTSDSTAPTESAFESITLFSGETGMLGTRHTQPFLVGYSVEVAHDSGVAAPLVGSIVSGRTLHVTPSRVESGDPKIERAASAGGALIHIEGLLDCAKLTDLSEYDPGTPDLGTLQVPTVETLQIGFSGLIESGGLLRLDVSGSGIEGLDGSLWIRALAGPSPAPAAWRVRDVAWLEGRVLSLPSPKAGTGIDNDLGPQAARTLWSPISAFDLLQSASQFRSRDSGRPALEAAAGLVFGPVSDIATWHELDSFADACERSRSSSQERLVIRAGGLTVSLPLVAGSPARVLRGSESTWLVDYDVTLAPETWMPIPEVQLAFDGLSVEAELAAGSLLAHGFVARTPAALELSPIQTAMAGLMQPQRTWQRGRVQLGPGSSATLIPGGPEAVGIELTVESP